MGVETEEAALGVGAGAGTGSIVTRGRGLDHRGSSPETTMIGVAAGNLLERETAALRGEEEEARVYRLLTGEDGTAVRREEIRAAEDLVPGPGTKRLNPKHHPSKRSFSNLPKAGGLELNPSEILKDPLPCLCRPLRTLQMLTGFLSVETE